MVESMAYACEFSQILPYAPCFPGQAAAQHRSSPPKQQNVKAAVTWDGRLFINATHVKYVLLGSIRKANSPWLPES